MGTQVKMRENWAKMKSFFAGLWIFRPKTAIFAVRAAKFPAFRRHPLATAESKPISGVVMAQSSNLDSACRFPPPSKKSLARQAG